MEAVWTSVFFVLAEEVVLVSVGLEVLFEFLSLFLEMGGQFVVDIIEKGKN